MKGIDEMDHSSLAYPASGQSKEVRSIGILGGDLGLDETVEAGYKKTLAMLGDHGYKVQTIDLPMMDYVVPAYYTIAAAEASANLARFNGVRYGRRPDYSENPEELVRVSRDEGFGKEVKLRVLLGTFVLRSGFQDQYYLRAQKIRTAIRNDFDRIFKDIDILLMPVYPVPAFSHGESEMDSFQQKVADKFTSTANLAGLPAISFPASIENGLPIGMQFIAPAFSESLLFDTLKKIEDSLPLQYPPGFTPDWS
jgi:aspartyl-tRNA(Asn)/glutamyl-tRNA(Gln) amidotransferase subunit A